MILETKSENLGPGDFRSDAIAIVRVDVTYQRINSGPSFDSFFFLSLCPPEIRR